jgi:hypothetical protein
MPIEARTTPIGEFCAYEWQRLAGSREAGRLHP